ncbi:MAG: AraC family transcriptional regulator [Pseudomonadales bacterium]|jgi:AraC-like DNA-binding protein|uniref:AraC family transcriptional regulator n=1 Tax=unclassified Ketobacter TaxID=2639109 RepID=UPI000C63ECCA|nr:MULTISPECIES: AraC family transcriptional regulator [unclassified Ketobacter]MAQ24425.1 AraC family transcriptional regulator [Pseudomonadales bacterium]MEC8812878.1 AraC family transcriptional regulator [Pseudomonadota bacterium]TNC87922.1 MAG: AraC family transcriptional regulator [Alcanivorax sp.]HAG93574.1 AraC family transcriptional regulator [Gammaproteobacteria bacterium]MBI25329.1 AraC family transcriptional regulator [Pseudomonadales bacterium]|tara:strand:+ start:6287 stop:7108 length:822 start_codon:yes stop_codon:yes gene_type:complete
MEDRLVELLKRFELHARVFQAGPLCNTTEFYEGDNLGYIHVVKRGAMRVESPQHPTLLIDEPSVFFYMNPTRHRLLPMDDSVATVCASLEFGAGLGNPLTRALPEIMMIRLRDMPSLDQALQLLFLEAAETHCGRQAVLDRLMEVVFIQVLRDAMDQQRLQVGLLAGLADERLAKAINAIHTAPAEPWTLEQLAQQSGMSRARFATHFHDVVGMTPGNYLTQWRLAVAQSLLRQGKPVQWVSDMVGYGSASALSRAFRSQVGMSPTQWLDHFS